MHDCDHSEDVSVRCILREDQRVKNITLSVEIISVPSTVHTALISWVLYNTTTDEPTSFDVKCSNEKHSILMSVSGLNVTTQLLMGLLPVTSYNCCVSTVYELYRADGICNEIKTPELFISTRSTTMNQISSRASDHDSETNVVGGVFGFIVVILFVLLIISGVGLAFLLPRWKKNAR